MIKFNLKRASFSGAVYVDCTISYDNLESESACLLYFDSEFGKLTFSANDLFSALEKTRSYLEHNGFLILCAGSMPNTYPSRMSRQMSNGRKAYVHTFGIKPDQSNIIDIFTPVDFNQVGTLKDQETFMIEWNKYFEG